MLKGLKILFWRIRYEKNRKLKIVVSLSLMLSVLCMNFKNVSSANVSTIEPLYVVTCTGNSKHLMVPIPTSAIMYSGTSLENKGSVFISYAISSKCKYCSMMVFSQFYPNAYEKKLGYYKMTTSGYMGSNGVYLVFAPYLHADSITQTDVLKGFDWS